MDRKLDFFNTEYFDITKIDEFILCNPNSNKNQIVKNP